MSDKIDIEFNQNEEHKKVSLGGGEKAAAKQKEKGKLLARERIDYLRDNDSPFTEVAAFAGDGMYPEHGGCPGAGVVCGI